MSKPIVGVTTGVNPEVQEEHHQFYQSYADAVLQAGGEPVFLDPEDDITPERIRQMAESISALLLTGGNDIHPDNYPSRNLPGDEAMSTEELLAAYRMNCDPRRDQLELPLARLAYDMRIPILGICRGFQLLNVALGGSLVKDIRTGRKHWAIRKEESDEGEPGTSRRHEVVIAPDSKLSRIIGATHLMVNSRHHQGVTEWQRSPRVKAVAASPDGIIEAIEGMDHPWAVAIQWHPERKADGYINEVCRPLFTAFVEAAGR